MEAYKNLNELFEARKNDGPDALLAAVAAFFVEAGKRYRRGLISEEDLYAATYYNAGFGRASLYEHLWGMKYGVTVNTDRLRKIKAFKEAWEDWKRNGVLPEDSWVSQCIHCSGDPADAVEWVFSVIDVCKVPLCEFSAIPLSDVGMFPNVAWRQDGNAEEIVLFSECLDAGGLLRDPAPQGKAFTLHFEGGTVAEFTVKTEEGSGPDDRRFTCVGTVTDYVETPQPLRIEADKTGYLQLFFGRKTASEWKLLSHTALTPIPHSKWRRFNEAHFAFVLRRETEYRILRLPYLFGDADETLPPEDPAAEPAKQGKIVKLFGD